MLRRNLLVYGSAASWLPSRASGPSTGFSAGSIWRTPADAEPKTSRSGISVSSRRGWPQVERNQKPGLLMMVVMTVLTGLIYPAVMTGVRQAVFPKQANGNLLTVNGQVWDPACSARTSPGRNIFTRGPPVPAAGMTRPPAPARTSGRRAPSHQRHDQSG